MKIETAREMAAAVPPAAVGGLTLFGVALNDWVLMLTIVWTVFLIIDKFPTVVQRLAALRNFVRKLRGRK